MSTRGFRLEESLQELGRSIQRALVEAGLVPPPRRSRAHLWPLVLLQLLTLMAGASAAVVVCAELAGWYWTAVAGLAGLCVSSAGAGWWSHRYGGRYR